MRDETIHALDALALLDPQRDAIVPDFYAPGDEVSAAVDRERAAIENDGEARAREALADIHTRRGLLLLFDVLIGITLGHLSHDQTAWTRRVSTVLPNCGTYRCLAGWLAQAGFPTSRPAFGTGDSSTVNHVFPDGTQWSIPTLAVAALLDEQPVAGHCGPRTLNRLFDGDLTLAQVWERAADATGRVVSLPAELADEVTAIDAERDAAVEA